MKVSITFISFLKGFQWQSCTGKENGNEGWCDHTTLEQVLLEEIPSLKRKLKYLLNVMMFGMPAVFFIFSSVFFAFGIVLMQKWSKSVSFTVQNVNSIPHSKQSADLQIMFSVLELERAPFFFPSKSIEDDHKNMARLCEDIEQASFESSSCTDRCLFSNPLKICP